MDAIESLVDRIQRRFSEKYEGWFMIDWIRDCILDELRAAHITIPPLLPQIESFWEHNTTGERRFVRKPNGVNLFNQPAVEFSSSAFADASAELPDWQAWSANATCLVPGKGA